MWREFSEHMCHQLSPDEKDVTVKSVASSPKQCITHPNLSLESKRVPSRRTTFATSTMTGLKSIRELVSNNIGVGVKRTFPPLSTVGNRQRNPDRLKQEYTVNMVDVGLGSNGSDYAEEWFDADAGISEQYAHHSWNNSVRLIFDQLMFAVRVGYLSDGSNPPSLQQCIQEIFIQHFSVLVNSTII